MNNQPTNQTHIAKKLLGVVLFSAITGVAVLASALVIRNDIRTGQPVLSKSEWRYSAEKNAIDGKMYYMAMLEPASNTQNVIEMFREPGLTISPGKEKYDDQVMVSTGSGKFEWTGKETSVTVRFDHGPRVEYRGQCANDGSCSNATHIEESRDFLARMREAKTIEIQVVLLAPREYATYEYNVEGYDPPWRKGV
jgi:hypothetical protein